ncbi:helix-turn-helix transcriptional regulator [Anaerovorax odorimutans]|nr:helix-turn-helix transcriptional regulator [Anaerovorax odorimutans]
MEYIEKNELGIISRIIYMIHTMEDLDEMRLAFLKLLQVLIPYGIATFVLSSNTGEYKLERPVTVNGGDVEILSNYLERFKHDDYSRWIFFAKESMTYRETDLLSEETRTNTKFFKEVYSGANIHYSAQISLAHREEFLGVVSIYRMKGTPDFSDKEMYMLDQLKKHLSFRLYKEIEKNYGEGMAASVEMLAAEYGLTHRENEILKLLLAEVPTEEIIEKLCISLHTLKKHKSNLYKKLHISGKWELYKLLHSCKFF